MHSQESTENSLETWSKLVQKTWNKETLEKLYEMAHKLTGGNLQTPHSTVETLEIFLKTILDTGIVPSTEHQEQIRSYLEASKEILLQVPHIAGKRHPEPPEKSGLIFMAEDNMSEDAYRTQLFTTHLTQAGYSTELFLSPTHLKETIKHRRPLAIIMDVMFGDGNGIEVDLFFSNALKPIRKENVPSHLFSIYFSNSVSVSKYTGI
jgi:hypothetical protein